ncbi:hypothetical protein AVEN_33974-1 [Araneus ventricosus]|uniref:Tc1-like transposase DDE domain-containing protein n=1 Tax=Araneus ventricosus TaxID=182803 RepID=A0A4Y2KX56_ARAVE|nr:hypothetical protein AVEN_33974-1 [Araneus ventricosus]
MLLPQEPLQVLKQMVVDGSKIRAIGGISNIFHRNHCRSCCVRSATLSWSNTMSARSIPRLSFRIASLKFSHHLSQTNLHISFLADTVLLTLVLLLDPSCHQGVECFVLLPDNARPHVALCTQQLLKWLRWEGLDHPTYCINLASSEYHLFCHLKRFLTGQHFSSDDVVHMAVSNRFRCETADFFTLVTEIGFTV